MRALRLGATILAGVKVGVLLLNCARFPVLGPRGDGDLRKTSVLVPARDEAERLPHTLPALLAAHDVEVVVLDDSSSDGTAAVAEDLIARSGHPRSRVVRGRPLPVGWTGKTWACHQLAEHASGDTLVFLDADIQLAPGALAAAVGEQQRVGADLFSVFPRQVTASLGEHLVVPVIDDVLLCLLPHPLLSLPIDAAATANGGCLVFTRTSYETIGGFRAVQGELIEDVALARRTRGLGLRLGLALGGPMLSTRMYRSYSEVVVGLARGLLFMSGGSRLLLVLGWLAHLGAYTLPAAAVAWDRRWAVPLLLALAERALVEVKTRRYAVWQSALVPAVAPAIGPLVWRALRGPATWRGRTYA
ncbi:MAG TPA: glycosyltransferase family 2 protein [Ornithinimicrobium sp.]|uniref:glycosyltransferase n=1 Tax=Ornithinimicrobium sp. TaxID=1977084 RepID=UPI002B4A3597|nr:glycosyltransferase family 2 protein [Ornithinimicrobium sp.]HKJ13105.1 glycosyltransferase family 2 protein [Ornithinimicrobium sp.]